MIGGLFCVLKPPTMNLTVERNFLFVKLPINLTPDIKPAVQVQNTWTSVQIGGT